MSDTILHLGFDDIDSPTGGCTTHFTSLLVGDLEGLEVRWLDYPGLVRLNPGIPYRTRGNGAVVLRLSVDGEHVEQIVDLVKKRIKSYANLEYPNTNPGFVMVRGDVPERVRQFSERALWRSLPIELASRIIQREKLVHYGFGNRRGLIGALASVGNMLTEDYTFEFIAYRSLEACGHERGVDGDSVTRMDSVLKPQVFANIDASNGQVLIEPHGPDPVLFGVRGENPDAVKEGGLMVRSHQAVERWMIFRTNQATGAHLTHEMRIDTLRPYMAAKVRASVSQRARIIEGGHVIFGIADDTGEVDCAVYEPTGEFRDTANRLMVGDRVVIHGSVRPASRTHPMTLNVEGIEVVALTPKIRVSNPLCTRCGKRMKSAGRGKGFKCDNCGHRERNGEKVRTTLERTLTVGLYLPPPRAQRHLTRPFERPEMGNMGVPVKMIDEWHSP
ncbi:MAG: TiaS agmantine-binding domain-containing protein [Candidatus Thorarchaeota archaeon]